MLSLRLLAGILLLGGAGQVAAECACVWGGPFTKVQADADLVVTATVITGKGNSIDVKIDQLIRGQEFQEQIRIWLRTGELCRPELEQFPEHSRWVMALHRIDAVAPGGFNPGTPGISFGRVGDYSLSSCGGYWLSRHENLVTGNLATGTRWVQDPKMSPVLLELVIAFVDGKIDAEALKEAGTVNPELQQLRLETRSFLRQQR
ncbi:MAG: delta-aminolevulinic acid dehydratase [Gammaproteobacteria bacterium]|nr:delta-aminolevulinic acid dehydratase [Gammaproteobacteria bacterium]